MRGAVLLCLLSIAAATPRRWTGLAVRGGSSKSKAKAALERKVKDASRQQASRERLTANLQELRERGGGPAVQGTAAAAPATAGEQLWALVSEVAPMGSALMMLWRLDVKDPVVLFRLRVAFGLYLVAANVIFALLRLRIQAAPDADEKVTIPPPAFLTNLIAGYTGKSEATEGAEGGGPDPANMALGLLESSLSRSKTIKEYDLQVLATMAKAIGLPTLVTAFMHFRLKMTHTLVFGLTQGIAGLLTSPLTRIYLYGMDPSSMRDLERPYKRTESPLQKFLKSQQQGMQEVQTDMATLDPVDDQKRPRDEEGEDDSAPALVDEEDLDWSNYDEDVMEGFDGDVVDVDEDFDDEDDDGLDDDDDYEEFDED